MVGTSRMGIRERTRCTPAGFRSVASPSVPGWGSAFA